MSPPSQQPESVPRATVESAVGALTKWMKKRSAEAPPSLLADESDDYLILQLSLRRIPASPITKPRLIPLPHPVIGHAGVSVCVISDDRPNSRSPPASDLLDKSKAQQLPVSEVIPLSALRTDYRPYESRRRLAGSYDLFIADRAILPLLPRVLGKAFYSTKKAPIGVNFARVGWPEQMRKVLGSTFLYLRTGTCSGIKVGRLDMKDEEIVDNVIAAVDAAVKLVPKKWDNVRALHLKAVDSVALPIYQVVPQLGMKIEIPPVAQLEGEVKTVDAIDSAEGSDMSKKKKKKKVLRDADGEPAKENSPAKEKSGKRKRNKNKQTEDVVMQEETQAEPEKKKKKSKSKIEEGKEGKRSKSSQTEDVMMQEETQSEPEKKKKKSKSKIEEGKKGKRSKSSLTSEVVSSPKKKVKKEDKKTRTRVVRV